MTLARLNQHVHVLHVEAEPDNFRGLNPTEAVGFFESLLQDEAHVLMLSVDASGEATGYLWAQDQERPGSEFTKPARTMYIHHIAVVPAARRHGVGKSLVAAIESEASERGISRLALDHWTFNEAAQRFFTSLGFEPYNVRMRRELDGQVPSVR
jgi:ribosomal protein S18 acetylase RimI-like enzyme